MALANLDIGTKSPFPSDVALRKSRQKEALQRPIFLTQPGDTDE